MFRMGGWTKLVMAGLFAGPGSSDVPQRAHAGKRRHRGAAWHYRHQLQYLGKSRSRRADWHYRHHREYDERGERRGSPEPPTV